MYYFNICMSQPKMQSFAIPWFAADHIHACMHSYSKEKATKYNHKQAAPAWMLTHSWLPVSLVLCTGLGPAAYLHAVALPSHILETQNELK